jgi:hypothetical protein
MDVFIAAVILIAALAWHSSQELLDAVSLASSEPAAIASSPTPDNGSSECERGHPLIIARDLTGQDGHEAPAHGS